MSAALSARDAGDAKRGIALVEQALADHPRHSGLWQVLGLLHRHGENSAEAIRAFDAAARLAPLDARIAHGQARVTMEAGLPSLAAFDRALRLAPSDGDLRLSQAAALLAEQGPAAASAALDAVLALSPDWIEGQRTRAQLRWLAGDREGYTEGLNLALQTNPQAPALWAEKINLLIRAELYDAARTAVDDARSVIGNNPILDAGEAIASSEGGDHTRAALLFDALKPFQDIPLAVRHIRHFLRTGEIERAARLGESLVGSPEAAQAWPYVALAWRMLGDPRWEWLEGQPGLIGEYDLTDEIGSLDQLAGRLRSLHGAMHAPVDQSVRGGTQTDGPLFARTEPEIRLVRDAIRGAVERHMAALPAPDPRHPLLSAARAPVRFAGSWSVRLGSGGRHANHIHPQGLLSSALYVAVPSCEEAGSELAGSLALGEPPAELGIDLPPVRVIAPRPGRLVLFPSTMWHGTYPFAEGERISIAFDVARP